MHEFNRQSAKNDTDASQLIGFSIEKAGNQGLKQK